MEHLWPVTVGGPNFGSLQYMQGLQERRLVKQNEISFEWGPWMSSGGSQNSCLLWNQMWSTLKSDHMQNHQVGYSENHYLNWGAKQSYEQGLTVTCCSEVHTHLSSPNPLHLIRSMQTSLLFMRKSNRKDDWCEPWKLLLQTAGEGESMNSFRGTGLG